MIAKRNILKDGSDNWRGAGAHKGTRLLCLAVSLVLCFSSPAPSDDSASTDSIDRLLDAIAEIESGNDPRAIGDKGKALGTYQIHRSYWKDGTRILGVDWDYGLAFDPEKARIVVRAYLEHYGEGRSLFNMARIHNGGPRGHRKKATLEYGRKVLKLLLENSEGPAKR